MRPMTNFSRLLVMFALLVGGTAFTDVNAALTVLGVQYQQDNPYLEYQCLWHDRNYPTSCGAEVVGANVHVYLRNDGASSATVSDVTLAGYSLKKILREKVQGSHPPLHSIYFYWDNPPQAILDAGEPVWYKADPATIPPGGVAQVVVRLRFVPVTRPVSVGVVTSAGTASATIPVADEAPQLASVGFSSDLTKVYLHWRHNGGAAPTTILMDGTDVTASAITVGDPTLNFGASVLQLAEPLSPMSYHVFQGVYADGTTATASLRAWVNPFLYGTWGATPTPDGDRAAAQAWIDDATNHGVNALVMNMGSSGLADLLGTSGGRQYAQEHGYGFVIDSPNQWSITNPLMWFIDDEPDAEEANLTCGPRFNLPCGEGHNAGVLAMSLLERGETLRSSYPLAPTTINMDGSFKPTNYYSYGQVADVLMVDSYYQKRLSDTYWYYPQRIPLYEKATVIYATSRAVTTAAEPNPSHFILYSNEYHDPNSGNIWPFPTPQSKRIEAYYALAGGAKGMAYWWFLPGPPPNGLGAGGPDAQALWKEIGLLGNEIKTAAPFLVTSHPVALTAQGSDGVWVRSLAVGVDTLILMIVNDQYTNDQVGTHYTPVSDATVTATLPAWIQSPGAFEITAGGLRDVNTQLSGNQLQLNLGTLDLTRMIVVTTNPELRMTIQQHYDQQVAPGVCVFSPEHCPTTPSITEHPAGVTVAIGDTARLTVAATGGSLSYQWQKDGVNLSNGNGISGATSATLQITDVQAGHAGGYRSMVFNSRGAVNSNTATLTVLPPAPPIITQQPSAQSVCLGGTAAFSVTATGEGILTYQWQRNQINLTNGGHYSGATTATLTVSSADSNDQASYRSVVTNGGGNATSNQATLAVHLCTSPTTGLLNSDFDASSSGWTVAPNWTSYSSGTATFKKDTTTYRSAPNAQRIQPPTSGAGAYAGIRQTVETSVGDAVTFVAWAYQDSPARYETARLGARFDGVASPPSNWANVSGTQVWTELRASGTVTVANGATVFLDVVRNASGGYWSSFDDVSVFYAYLPPAPLVSKSTATSQSVDVQPGSNSANNFAEYAINIGGGAYTLGTNWVQADGTIGATAVWQTDATWAAKIVTGLATGTAYTIRVKARYSGVYTQETFLGAGAEGTPSFTAQLRRYWVKPDWLSPYWGFQPRGSAPAPAVNRSGEISNRTYFRRAWLTEAWQWFWVDLLSLSKYQRVYSQLTSDEQALITRAFGGLTGDHLAFTNNAGSQTRNCYPCGEANRGEDMKIDPLICGGNTILGGNPVQNERGEWMVKIYSFNANEPPPVAALEMLDDPRVLWATVISTKKLPDGSFSLFGFPQLKDGTPVPYPYMTVEDYYYPLEELQEYPLTDPKRSIYNPP